MEGNNPCGTTHKSPISRLSVPLSMEKKTIFIITPLSVHLLLFYDPLSLTASISILICSLHAPHFRLIN